MAEKGKACQSRAVLTTLELARVPPLISERIHFSFSSPGSAADKAPEITDSFLTILAPGLEAANGKPFCAVRSES